MNIRKLGDYRWEIPVGEKPGMNVHGIIYADEKFISEIERDNSVDQVANAAAMPGIVSASLAMPDMHFGYGLPIGGVVAFDVKTGVLSPGATGYDINCGVRLIRSNLNQEDVRSRLRDLVEELFRTVPCGVGSKGRVHLSDPESKEVIRKGSRWAVSHGGGTERDIEFTEARGCLEGADPDRISKKAFERGRSQLGTLGSGNHFLEIQFVQEVFDREAADAMGLFKDQAVVMIHSGSRGLGHQVCTDYLEVMEQAMKKYHIVLPDKQLACAPIDSPEARDYLAAMRGAANFAWANRQFLTAWTREAFEKIFRSSSTNLGMDLVYDVAHNIIKFEEHAVDGERKTVAVHRKGATRAFPPGHPELPREYETIGQPVLIPGDMGRNSFVLVGTQKAMEESFGSTCHGAGRRLSRHAAVRAAKGRAINRELEDQGILVRSVGRNTTKEEMPEAYKDVCEVVDIVHNAGISKKVAKLKPMGVVKG